MTFKRWNELNDHLLSIAEDGGEIGEDNGCYRVDDGAYVREAEYIGAFEDVLEASQWSTICNLQTVDGLYLQEAIDKVNGLSREALEDMATALATDEDACVYYTEGWDD